MGNFVLQNPFEDLPGRKFHTKKTTGKIDMLASYTQFDIDLKDHTASGIYKIVLEAPYNYLNRWIVVNNNALKKQ